MSGRKIIILSGPKFSGKSLFIEKLLPQLREKKLSLCGFYQRGMFNERGAKIGYDLVNAGDGTSLPLARRAQPDAPWEFEGEVFLHAAGMVSDGADLCILDEIGPLELSGGGHAKTLEAALEMSNCLIIVVREELADEFRLVLPGDRELFVVDFDSSEEARAARRILEILS